MGALAKIEEQTVNAIVGYFKSRYPRAKAIRKENNLVGRFLEALTVQALAGISFWVYEWASEGKRGIDAKSYDESYDPPLFFAIECMNGRFDYTERYFQYLQRRIDWACSNDLNPIIVCVDKATNFARFKGQFKCDVEYVELGKQLHPLTATYSDYLDLKNKLREASDHIALRERTEEASERQVRKMEDRKMKEAEEAMEKLDEEELVDRVDEILDADEAIQGEEGWNVFSEGPPEGNEPKSDS